MYFYTRKYPYKHISITKMTQTEILARLITERKRRKISQTEMSVKLGVNRKTLYYYEKGKRDITFELAVRYCEELGFRLFMGFKEG